MSNISDAEDDKGRGLNAESNDKVSRVNTDSDSDYEVPSVQTRGEREATIKQKIKATREKRKITIRSQKLAKIIKIFILHQKTFQKGMKIMHLQATIQKIQQICTTKMICKNY